MVSYVFVIWRCLFLIFFLMNSNLVLFFGGFLFPPLCWVQYVRVLGLITKQLMQNCYCIYDCISDFNSWFGVSSWSFIMLVDRVFRSDCSTKKVYEEGAKEVALSVVSGINCEYKIVYFARHFSWLWKSSEFHWQFSLCQTLDINSSYYFCIWTNKQWKDIYYDGNHRAYTSGYLWVYWKGNREIKCRSLLLTHCSLVLHPFVD